MWILPDYNPYRSPFPDYEIQDLERRLRKLKREQKIRDLKREIDRLEREVGRLDEQVTAGSFSYPS